MDIKNLLKTNREPKNHEFRFSTSNTQKQKANNLYNKYFKTELKKQEFLRLTFEAGLEHIESLILQKTES